VLVLFLKLSGRRYSPIHWINLPHFLTSSSPHLHYSPLDLRLYKNQLLWARFTFTRTLVPNIQHDTVFLLISLSEAESSCSPPTQVRAWAQIRALDQYLHPNFSNLRHVGACLHYKRANSSPGWAVYSRKSIRYCPYNTTTRILELEADSFFKSAPNAMWKYRINLRLGWWWWNPPTLTEHHIFVEGLPCFSHIFSRITRLT
jgi:hypothetical protein